MRGRHHLLNEPLRMVGVDFLYRDHAAGMQVIPVLVAYEGRAAEAGSPPEPVVLPSYVGLPGEPVSQFPCPHVVGDGLGSFRVERERLRLEHDTLTECVVGAAEIAHESEVEHLSARDRVGGVGGGLHMHPGEGVIGWVLDAGEGMPAYPAHHRLRHHHRCGLGPYVLERASSTGHSSGVGRCSPANCSIASEVPHLEQISIFEVLRDSAPG
jgi:hypothetical protein